jgi:hypothetical protein
MLEKNSCLLTGGVLALKTKHSGDAQRKSPWAVKAAGAMKKS